ncbi:DUF2938 domain-containing protein [Lysobacter sp. Hz 25]|uniref:DUF2938 domain-containing protein n=1 Tax=Lysobacter sp. Hz 25 TaxID=3383698 RepID=UPI0038D46983
MPELVEALVRAAAIGIGATALMDVWGLVRARLLRIAATDYGLVGRWIAYLPRGRFRHDPIGATPRVRGERAIGWTAHYLIGIAFAAVLLAAWGLDWARQPSLAPALIVGIGSVAAPFLLMQPGIGAGLAARRTPRPGLARLHSLLNHTVFGIGLYLAALAANASAMLLARMA